MRVPGLKVPASPRTRPGDESLGVGQVRGVGGWASISDGDAQWSRDRDKGKLKQASAGMGGPLDG